MRIFQLVTVSEYGGVQSVVQNLAESLGSENEVFILYGGDGEAWKSISNKITKLKISEHRKELSWKDLLLLLRLFYYRLKYRPDIVHLHSSKMGALGRIAFNPKKIVYTVHGSDSIRTAFRKFLFVEKMLKNRSAKVIAVSKYDVEGLRQEGITKNVSVIYNGVVDYTQNSILPEEDENLSQQIKTIKSSYTKLIMCIARISKQKKFDLFLDMAKLMPQYAFVWLGNKEKIAELPSNVFCLGETYSAHMYLKYADLFVLPSNYEGLPISILEALSYSVPVVASSVGGVPEILNGKNGFAVDNDVNVFKEKIEYTLGSDVYPSMSIAARNSYVEKFTIDKMVNGYKSIFQEVYGK